MKSVNRISAVLLCGLLAACSVSALPTQTALVNPTPSGTPSPQPTFTFTPSPSATATPSPSPTPTPIPSPTPLGGSGKIILTTTLCTSHTIGYPDCDPQAVILVDLDTGAKQELAGTGYRFRALSPDGKSILISRDSLLYIQDLSGGEPVLLSSIFIENRAGIYGLATWLPDNRHIAFIGRQESWFDVYMMNLDGTDVKRITEPGSKAYQIYPSNDLAAVYWEKAIDTGSAITTWGSWITNLDGSNQHRLEIYKPVFPKTGNRMAYQKYPEGLFVSGLDGSNPLNVFPLSGDGFFWELSMSPSGNRLFFNVCADKSCDPMPYYLASSDGKSVRELSIDFTTYHAWWSPDEQKILLVDSNGSDRRGYTRLDLLDVNSGQVQSLEGVLGLSQDEFILRSEIAWLP